VRAVDLAQRVDQLLLLGAVCGNDPRAAIDEIVEARELMQADLPAELVVPRNAPLAVADQVERGDVDLAIEPFTQEAYNGTMSVKDALDGAEKAVEKVLSAS